MYTRKPFLEAFFRMLTDAPRTMVVLGLITILAMAAGLTRLVKDTSVDAFVPADHSSLLANERVEALFGLTEPIAVAVLTTDGSSIFQPELLTTVEQLAADIGQLDNVRRDRVASVASESAIRGADGAVLVEPYADGSSSESAAAAAAAAWRGMPPHVSTIVSSDETGAVIMAELIDSRHAAATYRTVQEIVARYQEPGIDILVAGPAAVSGYLSSYIERDARILQPLVLCVVLTFIFLAFRRASALIGPVLVVAGAAGGALGIMAWQGVPYFAITNALPVILVAIAVADAIHILSAYYQLRARFPSRRARDLVVIAMTEIARPITLTTLTTMAGFIGIGVASIMPPITHFAWYAALGVMLAWVFSLGVLPSILVLLKPKPSPAFRSWAQHRPDALGAALRSVGAWAARHHGAVLVGFAAVAVVALTGALQLRVDRSQVDNFAPDEPIRIADETINETFAGTAFLDVVVEADTPDGLLDARRMRKIAELQRFFESHDHVQKTNSIVDYLSLLHAAVLERAPDSGRALPDTDAGIAELLLVYEVSGDPTDLEEEIDRDYRSALIRGVLDTPYFSDSREVVESLERYIVDTFNEPGMTATLAGDVNVAYHWMSRLQSSHFLGVGLSLALVLAMAIGVFRSAPAGLVAVVPVCFTVLVLYALMGFLGIHLEPATSMFATISLGVGVDFAIHLVDRLRVALRLNRENLAAALDMALPGTARACLFNAAALGVGFAVLLASDLPTLQRFGGLISVAAFSSFLCALLIVPAAYAFGLKLQGKPGLPADRDAVPDANGRAWSNAAFGLATGLLLLGGTWAAPPVRAELLDGVAVAERVAARDEGRAARRLIDMTMTDRRGRTRQRTALVIKRQEPERRLTRITYLAPKSVREVSFLSHDYHGPGQADERWLYLPASRKVRRIPAADRGDYFLGTDFSYEDVQSELKFDLADYEFEHVGIRNGEGGTIHRLRGRPIDETTAQELGYGSFEALIDGSNWMPLEVSFSDLEGSPLKTIVVQQVSNIQGIWTALEITAHNHQTGHRTRFAYRDIEFPESLPQRLFQPSALRRGLRGDRL
jgi:predicted RND superfamily exporter protein